MDVQRTLELPFEGVLPELEGATGWLNSEPLTPTSLRGRPMLVQFWTFTCINWIRTSPYVRSWYQRYRRDGLIVLGVHTPEFDVERDVERVRRAADAMGIAYPIAVDGDYRIWRAFGNQYWPALYFADADGRIRHHRFGEGEYEYSEIVIQQLAAAAGIGDEIREPISVDARGVEAPADWGDLRSPETYVGYDRTENFASPGGASPDEPRAYEVPDVLRLNSWALGGAWTIGPQAVVLKAPGGRIAHRFHARDLHLVMAPPADGRALPFRVLVDGEQPGADHGVDTDEHGEGTVTEPRLYQLIRHRPPIGEHTFEISFPEAGAQAFVFTFG
jgi:thiol-disulfide isomerase/thioredoxin